MGKGKAWNAELNPPPDRKMHSGSANLHAAGYLHHFEWGCKDDDHTGWAIVEAENIEHARQIVPWYLRERARIVHLVKFDLATDVHKKTG